MNASLSVYFELIRPFAALAVVLHHLWPLVFQTLPLPWPGHQAVVVFFVLSGYVISHAAGREDARRFALNRVARIGSVAWPALLLSLAIAPFVGERPMASAGPLDLSAGEIGTRTLLNALFLGQSWGLDLPPAYNLPYWSLCYEVWYYLIFGICVYGGRLARPLLLTTALLLAGPKILLLLPVWLLGVALHRHPPTLSPRCSGVLFAASSLAIAAFFWFDLSAVLRTALFVRAPAVMASLGASNQFLGDFLLGLLVTAHFAAVSGMAWIVPAFGPLKTRLRGLSGLTFSIYLFHMPLAVLLWNGLGLRQPVLFWVFLAVAIALLGQVTERRLTEIKDFLERQLGGPRRA